MKKLIISLTVLALTSFACLSGGSSKDLTCVNIEVTSCDIDSFGGYVHGTLINNCKDKINAIKVVAEVYSSNGVLLSEDEEYVENLQPGQQKTFKAIMDSPASEGTTCKARIESGY